MGFYGQTKLLTVGVIDKAAFRPMASSLKSSKKSTTRQLFLLSFLIYFILLHILKSCLQKFHVSAIVTYSWKTFLEDLLIVKYSVYKLP